MDPIHGTLRTITGLIFVESSNSCSYPVGGLQMVVSVGGLRIISHGKMAVKHHGNSLKNNHVVHLWRLPKLRIENILHKLRGFNFWGNFRQHWLHMPNDLLVIISLTKKSGELWEKRFHFLTGVLMGNVTLQFWILQKYFTLKLDQFGLQ